MSQTYQVGSETEIRTQFRTAHQTLDSYLAQFHKQRRALIELGTNPNHADYDAKYLTGDICNQEGCSNPAGVKRWFISCRECTMQHYRELANDVLLHVHAEPIRFREGDRVLLKAHRAPTTSPKSHSFSRHWGKLYKDHFGTVLKVAPYGIGSGSSGLRDGVLGRFQEPRYMVELDEICDIGGDDCKNPEYDYENRRKIVVVGNDSRVSKVKP